MTRLAAVPSEWWLLHLWFLLDLLISCAVAAVLLASPLRAALGRVGDVVAEPARRRPAITAAALLLVASGVVLFGRAVWRLLMLDELLKDAATVPAHPWKCPELARRSSPRHVRDFSGA